MTDLKIFEQLLKGNHLGNDELERAYKLLYLLKVELDDRTK